MANLKIKTFPDTSLRKKAEKVLRIGQAEKKILTDMAEAMYLNNGVGLAAVQVGIDKQLAVVDVGEGLIKMVNPVIVKREGHDTEQEGCLSVPEIVVKVRRAKKVVVNFLNENGDAQQLRSEGLLARALQHEIDHLAGKLIVDYVNPIKRLFLKKKTNKSKKP